MTEHEKKNREKADKMMRDAAMLSNLTLDTAIKGAGHEAAANEFSKEAARLRREAAELRSNP